MAIPGFQALMLPLLQMASDGTVHEVDEAIEHLAECFKLTDDERKEMLPSGTQRSFNNRVIWARSYMKQAKLLEYPGRSQFRITDRGLKILQTNPPRIDIAFLMQFPEFVEFRKGNRKAATKESGSDSEQTPEEALESSYQSLQESLAQELLDRIKASPPQFFENLVVDLLVAMGYGGSRKDAGQAVGQSGDGGIDGIIKEDRLGLDVVYLQAKRWEGTVGRPVVQGFAGSLAGYHANKGVMITTSQFSSDAVQYARSIGMKIVLIDGEQLADLMIEHGVGVSQVATYTVKRIDLDYFSAE